MHRSLALLSLLLVCCFNLDPSKIRIKCDAENACPVGKSCIGGICGTQTGDMPPIVWNPAEKPVSIRACKNGLGYQLSDTMAACPVVMSNQNDINNQCGLGWSLCDISQLSFEDCASIPWGFFVGDQRGWQKDPLPQSTTSVCQWTSTQGTTGTRVLFGCGTDAVYNKCGGFSRIVLCQQGTGTNTSFTCRYGSVPGTFDFDAVTNTSNKNGVLCCN